jgi:catalase
MPLPSDEKLIQLGNELLDQFHTMFGPHPGFRPVHALHSRYGLQNRSPA